MDGELPVEFLSPGDRIITRDSGVAELVSIHTVRTRCEMISVMGGSLGHNKPDDDAVVPADQGVFLRDWRAEALRGTPRAVVPARELTDGEFIRSLGHRSATLYILEFDAPHILYVDGMELATELPETLPHAA